jgi:hypothetical protein
MFNNLIRYTLNFFLSSLVVLFFVALEWIKFEQPTVFSTNPVLNDLIVAGIIAMILFIVGEILGVIYKLVKTLFFFAGCIISFIYFFISGYLKLALTAAILPNWFDYRRELIIVLLISAAIGFIRLPHRDELSQEEKEFRKWKRNQGK